MLCSILVYYTYTSELQHLEGKHLILGLKTTEVIPRPCTRVDCLRPSPPEGMASWNSPDSIATSYIPPLRYKHTQLIKITGIFLSDASTTTLWLHGLRLLRVTITGLLAIFIWPVRGLDFRRCRADADRWTFGFGFPGVIRFQETAISPVYSAGREFHAAVSMLSNRNDDTCLVPPLGDMILNPHLGANGE